MSANTTTSDGTLLVGLAYAFVSTFMFIPYCISLYVIKCNRSIYDPAFRLFALNMGLADLQLMALMGIFPAVMYLSPFSVSFEVCRVLGAFTACAWYTYDMLAQMMSLNRLIGIFWPVKAKIIYTTRNTVIILVFCWLQGLTWTAFYLKPDVALYFDFEQKGLMYDFRLEGTAAIFFVNTMFNYVHVTSLCLTYGLIYYKLRRDRKQILTPTLSNDRKKENKVLIQAFVICSMDIALVATWVIFQNFATMKYALFVATIVALSSSGSTGYLYMLMNRTVWQKFVAILYRIHCHDVSHVSKDEARKYQLIQSNLLKREIEILRFMDSDVML